MGVKTKVMKHLKSHAECVIHRGIVVVEISPFLFLQLIVV